jgi:hypothetical protein
MSEAKAVIKPKKASKVADNLGWIGLGICVDYFVFKPVRTLRPLLYIGIGYVIGALTTDAGMAVAKAFAGYLKALFT